MTLRPLGRSTNSKTFLLSRASNSQRQASCHSFCSSSGRQATSLYPQVLGSVVALAIGGMAFARRDERFITPPSRTALFAQKFLSNLSGSSSTPPLPKISRSISLSDGVGDRGAGGVLGPGLGAEGCWEVLLGPSTEPSICCHSFRCSPLSISVGWRVSP